MKFNLKCSEHLVFNLFLIPVIENINAEPIWYLLARGTPCGTHGSTPKQ